MANVITGFRITAGLALLFCPVFSLPFYVLYLTSGLSDMVDGVVARRTNTASEFGAKLDTAADFVFVTVCLIRLTLLLKEQGYIIKLKLFPWLIIVSTHVQGATAVFPMKTMPVSRMTIWR